MVMSDKEFAEKIHLLIHSLRMIDGYKPSNAEKKISSWIIEKFKDSCKECKETGEKIKNQPEKKSFFNKLGDVING